MEQHKLTGLRKVETVKKRTKVGLIVATSVVICGAVGVYFYTKSKASDGPKGEAVRVEKPVKGVLVEMVNAPGWVEPRTWVAISARTSARIIDMPYDEGATVTKGDPDAKAPVPPSVLVKLDATDLEAELKSAEARRAAQAAQIEVEKIRLDSQRSQLVATDATLLKAKQDLDRSSELLKSRYVAQSDFDQARTHYDEVKAQRESADQAIKAGEMNLLVFQHNLVAADAEITRARDQLSYTVITSPIDGVVTRRNAKVGELVMTGTMNNPGTVILEVADLSQMLLVVQVDEADIGGIRVGQRANVRIHTYGEKEFHGTVESIALTHDTTNSGAKYFKTKILLDKTDKPIYSGLTADVDILTEKHEDILKVPSQAILSRPVDGLPLSIRDNCPCVDKKKTFATCVYRFCDGKAVVTPVTAGPSDQTHTIVEAGVSPNDLIIVGPYKVLDGLANDQKVQDEREIEKKKDAEKAKAEKGKDKGATVESTGAAIGGTGVDSTGKAE